MAKLLLNADGKVLMGSDKVFKAPESTLKKLLDDTKSCNYLFYKYKGKSVDNLINYNDTENVNNMEKMCMSCTNLETIKLNTNNVNNVKSMFNSCTRLQTVDITSLDKITSTSNITQFVYGCYSLTKLIIRNMTVVPALDSGSFGGCYHFDGTVNSTYNPDGLKDGRIYVPDNMVDQLKQATNWSVYADIIVPSSTLQEA